MYTLDVHICLVALVVFYISTSGMKLGELWCRLASIRCFLHRGLSSEGASPRCFTMKAFSTPSPLPYRDMYLSVFSHRMHCFSAIFTEDAYGGASGLTAIPVI